MQCPEEGELIEGIKAAARARSRPRPARKLQTGQLSQSCLETCTLTEPDDQLRIISILANPAEHHKKTINLTKKGPVATSRTLDPQERMRDRTDKSVAGKWTIRTTTGRLDSLINMVGGLIVSGAAIYRTF